MPAKKAIALLLAAVALLVAGWLLLSGTQPGAAPAARPTSPVDFDASRLDAPSAHAAAERTPVSPITPDEVPGADAPRRGVDLRALAKSAPLASIGGAITGRVLDELGAPAADVWVMARSQNGSASDCTGEDGAFRLVRQPGNAEPTARLLLRSYSHVVADTEVREVAWGTSDVELRVVRGGELTVCVTDAARAPVEDYTVRLVPRIRGRSTSNDDRIRAEGRHPNGTVAIVGLTPGDWCLIVEFPTALGFEPLFELFRHEAAGPRRIELRAEAASVRTLRVLAAEGMPVAGSKVQLCELFGRPLDDRRTVMSRAGHLGSSGSEVSAMVLFEGRTAADGTLALRGPGGRELGLCLLGPGHVPLRMGGVRLDVASEIVVRVSRGARLVGKVVPPEAVTELKRLSYVAPAAGFSEWNRPRLDLRGLAGGELPYAAPADLAQLCLADDGSFDIDGLPPGTWQLRLEAWVCRQQSEGSVRFPAGSVTLADGQTVHHDIALQGLEQGTVEGTVLLNGSPLQDVLVTLSRPGRRESVRTDADGQFQCSCFPGDYELLVRRAEREREPYDLGCAARVQVASGQTTRQTFALTSAKLRLTLRNADGKPVAGAKVLGMVDELAIHWPPTDADGHSERELAAVTVVLKVLPKHLSSREALEKAWQEAQAAGLPFMPKLIPLATVTLSPGVPQELELKLPADSGY